MTVGTYPDYFLDGKNILIVGHGSDMGTELMNYFKSQSINFFAVGRSSRILSNSLNCSLELTELESICIKIPLEKIDGIVFLIGQIKQEFIKDHSLNLWQSHLENNLIIPAMMIKYLYRQLNANVSIIFIGSAVADIGEEGFSQYAASKSALEGYMRSLNKEIQFIQGRANMISPHLIATKKTKRIPLTKQEAYRQSTLSKRIGTIADITHLILFLLSFKLSSYIQGQVIRLNGASYYR